MLRAVRTCYVLASEHKREGWFLQLGVQSVEQIAFADVILLNKMDLVDDAAKRRVILRIKADTSALFRHLLCLVYWLSHYLQITCSRSIYKLSHPKP